MLRYENLHEQVASWIEEKIVNTEFASGEILPSEKELARQLGVSRTVVRDAIKQVEARGLLEVKHGVGAIVTEDGHDTFVTFLELLVMSTPKREGFRDNTADGFAFA